MNEPFEGITTEGNIAHWKIGSVIGRGGNSVVYSANRLNNARSGYAIKSLKKFTNDGKSDRRKARFVKEISILSYLTEIKFQGVVPIVDSGDSQELGLWYAMPLASELSIDRSDDVVMQAISIVHDASEVIVRLHEEEDIVHRDIKPNNILLLDGRIAVADFGIARLDDNNELTVTNEQVGSLGYRAPESIGKQGVISGKIDVYGLAKTLWSLLTNEDPTMLSLGDRDEFRLKYYSLGNLDSIDELLVAGTDVEPLNRPTAREFSQGLHSFLNNEPIEFVNTVNPARVAKRLFPSDINKNHNKNRIDAARQKLSSEIGKSYRSNWNEVCEQMGWPKFNGGGGIVQSLSVIQKERGWVSNGRYYGDIEIDGKSYQVSCLFWKEKIASQERLKIRISHALSVIGQDGADIEIADHIVDCFPVGPELERAVQSAAEFASNNKTIAQILQRIHDKKFN